MRRLLVLRSFLLALSAVTVIASTCGTAAAAGTTDEVQIDWSKERVEGARVVRGAAPGGQAALRIDAPASGIVVHLVTIQDPSVEHDGYAIVGQVRYQGVEGRGYLEMWSVFPDGMRYFSRTLEGGPVAPLIGSSGWRAIAAPFSPSDQQKPSRLEINLVLPGDGTVWLGPMKLTGLDAVPGVRRGWWSDRAAGVFGGALGSLIGVLGASIGALAARGRARRFAIGSTWAVAGLGTVLLIVATFALASSQPRAVWYSAALIGGLCLILGITMVRLVRRRYAEAELRKMQAADAGRPLTSQRTE
jgi:hypothetical protein